jgi:serine/threonine-protein kinase
MEDASDHPSVRIFAYVMLGVVGAVMLFVWWFSEKQTRATETWDIVPIGARCETLGVEERTFGHDKAAFCAPFPRYGLQVWSLSRADVKAPTPAPLDPREAQIRVCMEQLRLDQRNCEAGIRQYEGPPG